ncbi:MAG: glycosyltransferase [Desulfovibrionaceae bacterium]
MKLLFLARSLESGGAERQLAALANGLSARGHDIHVAVFYPGGDLETDLHGPTLQSLGKQGRWDLSGFLLRLRKLICSLSPEVIHGYLGTANLLTVLPGFCPASCKAVWGVRASFMDLARYGLLERLHYTVEQRLAARADLILVNSQAGFDHASDQGFPRQRMRVVQNGIDVRRFCPLAEARQAIRREWGIPDNAPLVALPGRLDPMKDHPVFLEAAALVAARMYAARFVCVGQGKEDYALELKQLADKLGLGQRLLWAGARTDMPEIYNALDLVCLSSYGEGFPNVLGEAMACGTPCVATDVGDSALILGDLGLTVPPRDPKALAEAMCAMLQRQADEGESLRRALRARVEEHFSLERMVDRTEALLQGLLEK